jgi:hypothetical protein
MHESGSWSPHSRHYLEKCTAIPLKTSSALGPLITEYSNTNGAFYRPDWFQGLTFSMLPSPWIHLNCWMGRAGIPQGLPLSSLCLHCAQFCSNYLTAQCNTVRGKVWRMSEYDRAGQQGDERTWGKSLIHHPGTISKRQLWIRCLKVSWFMGKHHRFSIRILSLIVFVGQRGSRWSNLPVCA